MTNQEAAQWIRLAAMREPHFDYSNKSERDINLEKFIFSELSVAFSIAINALMSEHIREDRIAAAIVVKDSLEGINSIIEAEAIEEENNGGNKLVAQGMRNAMEIINGEISTIRAFLYKELEEGGPNEQSSGDLEKRESLHPSAEKL